MRKIGFALLAILAISIAAYALFCQNKSPESGMENSVQQSSYSEQPSSSEELRSVEQGKIPKTQAESPANDIGERASKQVTADAPNPKLKKLSIKEESLQVEKLYPPILNQKGFTEHEIEVIVRYQIGEIKSPRKGVESATRKAAKELGLSEDRKSLLDDSFSQLYVNDLVQFTTSDVAECLSRRLKGISECTKSVLEDYLKDLSLALESDVFVLSQEIVDLTDATEKKALNSCHETPARAAYQFKLVFVECDPM
ncbi:MAG: hypothetical protein NTX25_20205 [Proteobacteria bacterium]|nr:hypothetical protein [Pseudomonadota bacterium]